MPTSRQILCSTSIRILRASSTSISLRVLSAAQYKLYSAGSVLRSLNSCYLVLFRVFKEGSCLTTFYPSLLSSFQALSIVIEESILQSTYSVRQCLLALGSFALYFFQSVAQISLAVLASSTRLRLNLFNKSLTANPFLFRPYIIYSRSVQALAPNPI